MVQSPPQPQAVPTPENFSFEWANSEDAKLPLFQDKQHAPNPITPLSGWLVEDYWSKGATAGFAAMKQPIGMEIRRINTYYYAAIVPTVPPVVFH